MPMRIRTACRAGRPERRPPPRDLPGGDGSVDGVRRFPTVSARDHAEAAYNARPHKTELVELLAQAMLEEGDLQAMTDLLRDHCEQFPSVEAYLMTGRLMEDAGDLDRAERALRTAARIDGGQSVEPQLALADFNRRLGNDAAAMERYRMALFVEPDNTYARDMIRSYGEIPGPTLALPPIEWAAAE